MSCGRAIVLQEKVEKKLFSTTNHNGCVHSNNLVRAIEVNVKEIKRPVILASENIQGRRFVIEGEGLTCNAAMQVSPSLFWTCPAGMCLSALLLLLS